MMVGKEVPPGDEHWVNFLDLLDIVDLLLAPEVTEDCVADLSTPVLPAVPTCFSHANDALYGAHGQTYIKVRFFSG